MNPMYKKVQVIVLFVFFFLGISAGLASAAIMTVEGKEDAGLDFGVAAFARFVDATNPNITLLTVLPLGPQFLSAADAYAFVQNINQPWYLQSAGNIWSATDQVVGESLSGLDAGTYRIAPTAGAFMYDSWGWAGPAYSNQYWWHLMVRADDYSNGQIVNSVYAVLGSATGYASTDAAFQAVQGDHLDITLAQGGSLNFFIYDWNSLDNSGGLSFSVTPVPEPATFLLLMMGFLFLARRVRS